MNVLANVFSAGWIAWFAVSLIFGIYGPQDMVVDAVEVMIHGR